MQRQRRNPRLGRGVAWNLFSHFLFTCFSFEPDESLKSGKRELANERRINEWKENFHTWYTWTCYDLAISLQKFIIQPLPPPHRTITFAASHVGTFINFWGGGGITFLQPAVPSHWICKANFPHTLPRLETEVLLNLLWFSHRITKMYHPNPPSPHRHCSITVAATLVGTFINFKGGHNFLMTFPFLLN